MRKMADRTEILWSPYIGSLRVEASRTRAYPDRRRFAKGWWVMFALLCAYVKSHCLSRWFDGKFSSFAGSGARQRTLAVLAAALLAGCSVHPIPDDVSPLSTEEIVRGARCEMRLGVLEQIVKRLKSRGIAGWEPKNLQTKEDWTRFAGWLKGHIAKHPADADLYADLIKYGQVSVAYDFDFSIMEHNNLVSSLAFKLPLAQSTFDLSAGGSLNKTRDGKRKFKANDTFAELVTRDTWCAGFKPRDKNLLYPITGEIGLRKVVETFIAISEQGGGEGQFVDTITFTTTIKANLGPSLKINPVPNSFRLVSATATIDADRTDVHKVIFSLAFPIAPKSKPEAVAGPVAKSAKASRPVAAMSFEAVGPTPRGYEINAAWRARYYLCVADAREREEALNTLRLSAPEVYCMTYADAFGERYVDPRLQRQLLP